MGKRIKNFFFCLKYPFWRSRNVWTGKQGGYRSTFYDWIPDGWRKAFGIQLSEDIKKAFKESKKKNKKLKWKDALQWEDIKEKYGTLRLYASTTVEIQEVLNKYELMSEGYCIECGKPARYRTSGWIEYYCEDCFNFHYPYDAKKFESKEEYKKFKNLCRLKKRDIPKITKYSNDSSKAFRVNIKETYGIDFEELWGLKK